MDGTERLELADWRRRVADLYAAVRSDAATDPARAWERWRATREELFRTHPQSPVPPAKRPGFRASHWPYDPAWRFEVALAADDVAGGAAGGAAGGGDAASGDAASGAARGDAVSGAAGGDAAVGGDADAGDAGTGASGAAVTLGAFGLVEPIAGGFTLALPISTGGEEDFARIGALAVPFPGGPRTMGLFWMAGYAGGLFLPFRDATNGRSTYGAGRYLLDTAKSADLGPGASQGSLVLDFNFAFHPSCAFDARWSCPLAPPENRLDIPIEAGERLS